jgi:hypothetical protein
MHFTRYVAVASFLGAAVTIAPAQAQNLVQNPSFETGDFTSWNTIAAASGSLFGVGTGFGASDGSFAAYFGATGGQYDTISQAIATTPGQTYAFSFDLQNIGVGGDSFIASWDGGQVLNITPSSAEFGFTHFAYPVIASTALTTIQFQSYDGPSYFVLDNVSVESTTAPEPGSLALLALSGFPVAVGIVRRRKQCGG